MGNNNFAEQLRKLMKEHRVTGQKIGEKVGVSQKSISRYASGEIEPGDEMKKKILQAIKALSKSDWVTIKTREVDVEAAPELKKYLPSKFKTLKEEYAYREKEIKTACQKFSGLTEKEQNYILTYFDTFAYLSPWEIILLKGFHGLHIQDQNLLIEELKYNKFVFADIQNQNRVCERICTYMKMQYAAKGALKETEESKSEVFCRILKNRTLQTVEYMEKWMKEFLQFDAKDWYFLMLVSIVSLSDRGINYTYGELEIVGDRTFELIERIIYLADDL